MGKRQHRLTVFAAVLVAASSVACSRKTEVITKNAAGHQLRAEDIDRNPLALLPSGATGIVTVRAPELFASEFGQKALEVSNRWLPVPREANYEPRRDLEQAVIGLYVMEGADFVGAASGRFDPAAIERAAQDTRTTAFGLPVVKSSYAGRTLFTANGVGFSVLTERTALFGNEVGIRRALDRIEEGRLKQDVPKWAVDLLNRPQAPLAAAFDLRESPATEAVRGQLPFLNGLSRVRLVGNFQPPGINVAGTASYSDEASAGKGASELRGFQQLIQGWGWLAPLLGVEQPFRQLDARASGKQLEVVAGLDARAVASLLDRLATMSAAPRAAGG